MNNQRELREKRIVAIVNSRSSLALRRAKEAQSEFAERCNFETWATTRAGHAVELAEQAVDESVDALIVIGGDGTINECANGLLTTNLPIDQLPAMAIWPSGSGNDFSRTFACPRSLEQLLKTIVEFRTAEIDVGKVEYQEDNFAQLRKSVHKPSGTKFLDRSWAGSTRHFINIAEIGIGTTVIQRATRTQRYLGDRISYQLAILRTVITCPEFEAKVSGDDFSFKGRFSTIAVANARFFGSGLGIAPDADVSDGLLDVVLLRAFSPLDFIRYLGKLRRCEPIVDSRVQVYQTTKLSVEGQTRTSMDGELSHPLPVEIEVLPRRLKLLLCGK
ncbi:MAG TPA: diacylglycerol kinase family lipid kinase [Pirellulaceae bacterium]|nr:diacylglycerol kinase family lipid kinase [Pirellulaceae bacterium]HMO91664.1 diacylglycerol kinase family lipid kinase [Pirellulaceae bacterium]HMP68361.1 diacylglycerol kinase family lipid kinase [Pirellulaceae bacterium]